VFRISSHNLRSVLRYIRSVFSVSAQRTRPKLFPYTTLFRSVPVIVLAMVPPLQFTYWQWLSLTLAAPVVTWAAWPFHRAASVRRSEEHTSELQSRFDLVCRLLLEEKNTLKKITGSSQYRCDA